MDNYLVDRYDCSRKLCIITNLSCNLRCIYCYQGKDSEHHFEVVETKEKLISILHTKTEKGTFIKFLGGEPFLMFKQIKELCEAIWDTELEENYLFHATTNGTLIHGKIKKWLAKNARRFTVKLSLDGNREAQEINRPGSFDKIDFDFFISHWPQVGVKAIVSPKTLPMLADSLIFLHSRGFKTIRVNLAELTDWNTPYDALKVYKEQLMKVADFYLANPQYTPCKLFRVPFRRVLNTNTSYCQCTIGRCGVMDYNTGKCYPCIFFMPSVCGIDKSSELEHLDFSNPDSLSSAKCKPCPFLNICVTCYASNYIQRGSICERDDNFCKFQQVQFAVVADYMLRKYVYSGVKLEEAEHPKEIYQDIKAICKIFGQGVDLSQI